MTATGRRSALIGLAMMVGGMLVTFATYVSAEGGSKYLVLWGAVAFGVYRAVLGLKTMWVASRLPRV